MTHFVYQIILSAKNRKIRCIYNRFQNIFVLAVHPLKFIFKTGGMRILIEDHKVALCGGIAGVVGKTTVAPLDRLKIHFQIGNPEFRKFPITPFGVFKALRYIHQKSGTFGLFRGHSVTVIRVFPYAGINFYTFESLKRNFSNHTSFNPYLSRFLAGSMAGVAAVSFTYPLDLFRALIAYDTTPGRYPLVTFKTIVREMSIQSMFRGYFPTVLGIFPYSGVSFLTFETLKQIISKGNENHSVAPSLKLLFGMISGAAAQTAAYPLDTFRRRVQLYAAARHLNPLHQVQMSYRQIVYGIYRENGWRGFYSGLTINYMKVAPATGISFLVYETLKENFLKKKS